MAEQERKQKRAEEPVSGEGAQPSAKVTEKGNKLKEDMDNLMDTIDDILEENAEEFLKSYVQRGGEWAIALIATELTGESRNGGVDRTLAGTVSA